MAAAPSPRWNPFAFPSDTDFRFWLLIAAVLGTSLLMYQAMANALAYPGQTQEARAARCAAEAERLHPGASYGAHNARLAVFNPCLARGRPSGAWALAATLGLGAAAGAAYLAHPAWTRRRRHLAPLTGAAAAPLVAEFSSLSAAAGLGRPPELLWNPLEMARTGLAFGTPGHRKLAVSGGLATTLWTDPEAFRAVVLHELAHLRNRDVDKAYLTVAVWYAFVAVAVAPFALTGLLIGSTQGWPRLLSLAALAVVVYLLRNATLRARETFADVRAARRPGYAAALERILRDGGRPAGRRRRIAAPAPLRRHPPKAARLAAVSDPGSLFNPGFWVAAGAGLAASTALQGAAAVAGTAVAAVLYGALVSGVAGMAVWRSVFIAAAARRRPPAGLGRLTLGLAAGFVAGDATSLAATAAVPRDLALDAAGLLVFDLLWYALLLGALFLFVRWTALSARAWLPVAARLRSPRPIYLAGLVPATAVMAGWLSVVVSAENIRTAAGAFPISPLLLPPLAVASIVFSPVLLLVLQLLWLTPLVGFLWPRRDAAVASASWATLELGRPDGGVPNGPGRPRPNGLASDGGGVQPPREASHGGE